MSDFAYLCLKCKHRGTVPGDAHSCCHHPKLGNEIDRLEQAMMFMMYGKSKLQIIGDYHGIRSGWFAWPINFDPAWLENCNGFEEKV